nr:hypothetical protein [Tanacetum cinerariifolium]
TERCRIQVVAHLPRLLVCTVEVGVLDRVGEVDRVASDEVEGRVAIDLLPGQGKRLRTEAVLGRQAVGGVIDGPGTLTALIQCAVKVAVQQQRAVVRQY